MAGFRDASLPGVGGHLPGVPGGRRPSPHPQLRRDGGRCAAARTAAQDHQLPSRANQIQRLRARHRALPGIPSQGKNPFILSCKQ